MTWQSRKPPHKYFTNSRLTEFRIEFQPLLASLGKTAAMDGMWSTRINYPKEFDFRLLQILEVLGLTAVDFPSQFELSEDLRLLCKEVAFFRTDPDIGVEHLDKVISRGLRMANSKYPWPGLEKIISFLGETGFRNQHSLDFLKLASHPSMINLAETLDRAAKYHFVFRAKLQKRNSEFEESVLIRLGITQSQAEQRLRVPGYPTLTVFRDRWAYSPSLADFYVSIYLENTKVHDLGLIGGENYQVFELNGSLGKGDFIGFRDDQPLSRSVLMKRRQRHKTRLPQSIRNFDFQKSDFNLNAIKSLIAILADLDESERKFNLHLERMVLHRQLAGDFEYQKYQTALENLDKEGQELRELELKKYMDEFSGVVALLLCQSQEMQQVANPKFSKFSRYPISLINNAIKLTGIADFSFLSTQGKRVAECFQRGDSDAGRDLTDALLYSELTRALDQIISTEPDLKRFLNLFAGNDESKPLEALNYYCQVQFGQDLDNTIIRILETSEKICLPNIWRQKDISSLRDSLGSLDWETLEQVLRFIFNRQGPFRFVIDGWNYETPTKGTGTFLRRKANLAIQIEMCDSKMSLLEFGELADTYFYETDLAGNPQDFRDYLLYLAECPDEFKLKFTEIVSFRNVKDGP